MVRMPKRDGEEEGSIMNHDSSDRIYVTKSVEAHYIFISQNTNMKEEEKIKNIKLNGLKRNAHMKQRAKSFTKLVANLPSDIMPSEDPSTPSSSKSSSPSQSTSSRKPIRILEERWLSFLI